MCSHPIFNLFQLSSPVTSLSSQYFPIPTPYIMFLLNFTQHFQILISPYWLGYYHSCKLQSTNVPRTNPPSLWSPLPKRPGGILLHCTLQNHTSSFLLSILLSLHFALRLILSGVTVNCVDPGVVYTEIMKQFSWLYRFLFKLSSFFIKVGRGGAGLARRGWGRALLVSVSPAG